MPPELTPGRASPGRDAPRLAVLLLAAAAMLLAACATSRSNAARYQAALQVYARARSLPGFDPYVDTFIRSQNARRLDRNSGCYAKGPGERVVLILMVDRTGRIIEADSEGNSAKAKCFRKAYSGVQMPIPPFFPFPVQLAVI